MEHIRLDCVLMSNNELLFNGKSLGFITDEEKEKHVVFQNNLGGYKNT